MVPRLPMMVTSGPMRLAGLPRWLVRGRTGQGRRPRGSRLAYACSRDEGFPAQGGTRTSGLAPASMPAVPAGVAQLAEQPSCKRQVSGSNPLTGSYARVAGPGMSPAGARPSSAPGARRDSGRGASAGLGRDEKEPVPAGHDRPGAGVLVQGAEAVPVFLEAVPRD
jgi:hypothetical protein